MQGMSPAAIDACDPSAVQPRTPPDAKPLRVLAMGMNWFSERSGGLDRVFAELTRSLPATGIDVTGLVLGPPDAAARTNGRVQSFGRPGAKMPERLWRARSRAGSLAATKDFDLVAPHFAMFAYPALGQLRDLPMVMHFHGPWADESAEEGVGPIPCAIMRHVERVVYKRAQRVIVLSRAFAAVAQDKYGVPESALRMVPGTVDLERFNVTPSRQAAREHLGWPQDRRIIVAVRRLSRRMGLDRLIDAMATVAKAHPDVQLMIAGRGHMAEALRDQVAALGLEQHVRFLGFVPDADLPYVYRAGELNLVPTAALEGFGLTTAEALASGTPSIVSPVGALPEVVGDLSPDLIFPSGRADDIAAHLIMALDGRLNLPAEAECRAYVQARYSAHQAAAAVAAVYREVA